jgi:hypothetical protein
MRKKLIALHELYIHIDRASKALSTFHRMSFVAAAASPHIEAKNSRFDVAAADCCEPCCACEAPVAVAPRPQRVAFGMSFQDEDDDFLFCDYASDEGADSDSEEDLCSSFELQASIRASLTSWR